MSELAVLREVPVECGHGQSECACCWAALTGKSLQLCRVPSEALEPCPQFKFAGR